MNVTFTSQRNAVGAALFLALTPAIHTAADEHEHEQHTAHVHGFGTLNVALDGGDLHVELRVPAMNIAGFEHAPATEAEHKVIEDARAVLEDPANLFAMDRGAECEARAVSVVFTAEAHADHHASHAGHHDDEHESEAHAAHHDEGAHEEHHDPEAHAEHDGETHSEVEASYRFHCRSPERLQSIDLALFERFPGIEELEAQVLGPGGQSRAELSSEASRLRLPGR